MANIEKQNFSFRLRRRVCSKVYDANQTNHIVSCANTCSESLIINALHDNTNKRSHSSLPVHSEIHTSSSMEMQSGTVERLEIPYLINVMSRRNSIYKKSPKDDNGRIHIIREVSLPMISFNDQYIIEQILAEGCFAKIMLATHQPTQTQVVLKAVHVELTTVMDFQKEFHFNYELSHHRSILSAYNVAFQTKDYYVFAMEHAPYGDLASNLGPNGLHENACKLITQQLSSALDFMHSKNLVHRDLKLENVLVFAPDFSRIKLCDFGAAARTGLLVGKVKHTWTSFVPPEILEIVKNERFHCLPSSDSWQFGILMYHIITGSPPWLAADWVKDVQYSNFMKYQQRKTTKIPENFRRFSARFMRCFRKYLCYEADDRCKITEVVKYMKDRWVECRISISKSSTLISPPLEQNSCIYLNQKEQPHSADENKIHLKRLMSTHGLECSLDKDAIHKRVVEWLANCDESFDIDCESLTTLKIENGI